MGRKAYEETVREATEQYSKWGIDRAEDKARTEVAPLAERVDNARKNAPAPTRQIEPGAEFEAVPIEKHEIRFALDDENAWGLERFTGNASPRAAFHSRPNREAMKTFHDRTMAALRERLGG